MASPSAARSQSTSPSTPSPAADQPEKLPQQQQAEDEEPYEFLRMQIVIRHDLKTKLGWPEGAIIGQGAHAATAVLHAYKEEDAVKEYLVHLDRMHKVVWSTKSLDSLKALSAKLLAHDPPIKHYLWVEQPENEPTALATVPNRKTEGVLDIIKKSKCSSWR